MARFTVDGIQNAGTDDVVAIGPEQWGLHGPMQTQWVERHVYWVLPLGTLFLFSLLFLVFFWGFGGSFQAAWGRTFSQGTGQIWTPAQPVQPTRPVASILPATAPAVPPQVTVNFPGHIQVDATVRNVPPIHPVEPRPLSPEERAEKLKQELRRQYGVQ